MNIDNLFRLTRNVAKLSTHRYKMGAVLVIKGHPISVGCNQSKTHPKAIMTGLHAEEMALKTCEKYGSKKSIMFIYREKHDGSPGLARPCEHCMQKLKEFGVKEIWYSTNEYPFFRKERI